MGTPCTNVGMHPANSRGVDPPPEPENHTAPNLLYPPKPKQKTTLNTDTPSPKNPKNPKPQTLSPFHPEYAKPLGSFKGIPYRVSLKGSLKGYP